MGAALAKAREKKKRQLMFHETSSDKWTITPPFGKEHVVAIQDLLECMRLQMMADVIFEYLGESKDAKKRKSIKWNHPNYTTFIHTKGTPLDDGYKPPELKKQPNDRSEYNIVMLGAGGVGKTALILRYVADMFVEDYDPRISDHYRRQIPLDVRNNQYDGYGDRNESDYVMLEIVDTYGGDEITWLFNGHIFLLVFDVVDPKTFDEVKLIREQILRVKREDDYPVIAVGNKCDLRVDGGRSGADVDINEVHDWCKEHQIPYIETSAKNRKNVNFMFRHCVYEYRMWLKHQ